MTVSLLPAFIEGSNLQSASFQHGRLDLSQLSTTTMLVDFFTSMVVIAGVHLLYNAFCGTKHISPPLRQSTRIPFA